jgi:predicted ATP-binding protein involved in virulence
MYITVLTEKTIKQDKKDPTFVLTDGYHKAQSALNELGITILKGRYGTGKSTMALHNVGSFLSCFIVFSVKTVIIIKNNKNLFTFVSNDFGEVLYKPECTYVFSKTIFRLLQNHLIQM